MEERREKMKRAALPCPPEYREAYADLLEQTHRDTVMLRRDFTEGTEPGENTDKWRAITEAELAMLRAIVNTPELDPVVMAEIFDPLENALPDAARFAERLRTLSLLREPIESLAIDD